MLHNGEDITILHVVMAPRSDEDAIHSVKNPSSDQPSGALHVYGGDLIGAEKSMWAHRI